MQRGSTVSNMINNDGVVDQQYGNMVTPYSDVNSWKQLANSQTDLNTVISVYVKNG